MRLVNLFDPAAVEETVFVDILEPNVWQFDGEGTVEYPDGLEDTFGWTALNGIENLAVSDGLLAGRTGETPMLAAKVPAGLGDDLLHSVEIRMQVSEGENFGVTFVPGDEPSLEAAMAAFGFLGRPALQAPLVAGDGFQTYILTLADSTFLTSITLATAGHMLVHPSDAEGAEFEIESVRLVSRKEELASIPSGLGWHGLAEIYRETIVTRSPERVSFDVDLPPRPWLDLTVGTIEDHRVTFRVEAGDEVLLERTVTTPNRWESVAVDLGGLGGSARLTLSVAADEAGRLGFWGAPIVRSRGALPAVAASEARRALTSDQAPQGVILIIADTLRRDHLDTYGYERPTAPVLSQMASEGVLFANAISQATWTKVSVPTILTSLYPRTHGIIDLPDRMPSVATTIEEVFQSAGYATFHTSSVPFSGKLTNLHQGVEVLHESSSLGDTVTGSSKTARDFIDRFLDWVEPRSEVPFFAMLHFFDPHTPFEPAPPYDTMWTEPDGKAQHEARLAEVVDHIESEFMKAQGLPTRWELDAAEVDADEFVEHEYGWYDGSIRAMDAEIGRMLERLESLGIAENTLVAFISDHGEEFLEHDRHWHGVTAYGEMLNVPMIIHWPGVVPSGVVIDDVVQSLDLMPTLIDLAGIEIPETLQGQSLVPLLANPDAPESLGWEARPAFAERMPIPGEPVPGPDVASFAIVSDGWKLIHNVERPDDFPEFELFNHTEDPLDLNDVAADNPDVVQRLAAQLNSWREWAEGLRLSDDDTLESMDPKELARLRALGYIR